MDFNFIFREEKRAINELRATLLKDIEKAADSAFLAPEEVDEYVKTQTASVNGAANKQIKSLNAATMAVSAVATLAFSAASNEINYQLAQISFETGDSDYAAHVNQKIGFATGWAKLGASIGGAAIAGFAVGNVAGAIIAPLTVIASTFMSDGQNERMYNLKYDFNRLADNFKVDYSKARSGTFIYGGGREK